ncbi:MAG: hypothetical protein ACF8MF_05220 [Phycisphaerales bacterium JB052]
MNHKSIFITVIGFVLALCTGFCRADIVTLKDGTTHEGTVVSENRAQVVLEIVIANIKTTKTFPRYKVRSIEYKPIAGAEEQEEDTPVVPEADDEREQNQPDASASPDKAEDDHQSAEDRLAAIRDRELYIVIPIEGTIGVESNADGLKKALTQARRRKAKHIVFEIDSGGGYVYDAVESLKVLKEFDDDFEYHALVVEGAISAASIYVAASDHIWVRADARVGGAVAYSSDTSTGAAEVDAKMNSIWAADIAARAQSKGHPPEVFRAMVEPGAEVWFDQDGKVYPSRPSGRGGQQIDNSRTILTIRADQMIEIGMAKLFEGEISELGEMLEIRNWAEIRGLGARVMLAAGRERAKMQEQYEEAIVVFRDALEAYEANDPRTFEDYTFYIQPNGSRYPDGVAMQKWRERSDKAIRNCDDMLAALVRIADVNKRAKRAGALHLEVVPDDLGHEAYTTISEARAWLASHRDDMTKP